MSTFHTPEVALHLIRILISAFLAILFLQSGLDKVLDWRGNLEWLKGHFAKSPLAGMVPLMVAAITVLELTAGILSGIGCAFLIGTNNAIIAFYGAAVAAVAILALFFGQRMAKEYAGAAVLVSYFILALIGIFLLAL